MVIPRAIFLLDFLLTVLVFVQNSPGSGFFFAFNSGLPFLVLLSFGLEFMEVRKECQWQGMAPFRRC